MSDKDAYDNFGSTRGNSEVPGLSNNPENTELLLTKS